MQHCLGSGEEGGKHDPTNFAGKAHRNVVGMQAVGADGQVRPVPLDRAHWDEDQRRMTFRFHNLADGHQLVLDLRHVVPSV